MLEQKDGLGLSLGLARPRNELSICSSIIQKKSDWLSGSPVEIYFNRNEIRYTGTVATIIQQASNPPVSKMNPIRLILLLIPYRMI